MKSILYKLLVLPLALSLVACGAKEPELPAADTMEFPDFKEGQTNTAVAGPTTHVALAAASVGIVTVAVNLALLSPRLIFAGVISEKPKADGDEWVWTHDFPLLGINGELRATGDGDTLKLAMRVNGLRADSAHLNNFLWYTGERKVGSGVWDIYDPGTAAQPGPTAAVVHIDWKRQAADNKDLTFTNTREGGGKYHDSLIYGRHADLAKMTVHDEKSGANDDGAASDFSVEWDVENGAGKMSKDSSSYCWDTLVNGQVNLTSCPSDWPASAP